MKKYISVYYWNALEKVKEGKDVHCIDKECKKVYLINKLFIDEWFELYAECEKDSNYGRFEFYYIENETVEADTSLEKAIAEVKRFEEGKEE